MNDVAGVREVFTTARRWLDAGTSAPRLQVSVRMQTLEERPGLELSCLEATANRRAFTSFLELAQADGAARNSADGRYTRRVLDRDRFSDAPRRRHRRRTCYLSNQ